jgi:ATP-dependent Clp protease ATP-binding subunit ClpB
MRRLHKLLDPMLIGPEAGKLDSNLRKRIVGQDDAIQQIVDVYQTYLVGMASPGRPIGNLLFLGPTGSGKTRLVEAAAESLVGDARAAVKIDCGEFQHSHEIAKLIGSPPGYLGHGETHPLLSQEVLNRYHTERMKLSFVLFDEIEKASDTLWNLLLGILDKATLTLGDNQRVDLSRALIFMTSNLGAREMTSLLWPNLGFAASETERQRAGGIVEEKLENRVSRTAVDAARRKFTPEFMNRIDKTVVFKPLGEFELRQVLAIELNSVQQRIFRSASRTPFVFSLTDSAKDFLLREGTNLKYGARHLKRAIERNLVHPLSNLIATDQLRGGDLIRVGFDRAANRLTFLKEAEDTPAHAMRESVNPSVAPHSGVFSTRTLVEMSRGINLHHPGYKGD